MEYHSLRGEYVFVIRDKSLRYIEDNLKVLGFKVWQYSGGYWGNVDWAFVNIESKLYARGRPSVSYTKECVGHAVTLVEFLIANTMYIQGKIFFDHVYHAPSRNKYSRKYFDPDYISPSEHEEMRRECFYALTDGAYGDYEDVVTEDIMKAPLWT